MDFNVVTSWLQSLGLCFPSWKIRTLLLLVHVHFTYVLFSRQSKRKPSSREESAHFPSVSARVRSAPVCSGAEKLQESGGSDHTGRDRAACIPAFLQIRPGKADYSDPFPSPSPVWVEGEGGYF